MAEVETQIAVAERRVERSCVACGSKEDSSVLLRVILTTDNTLVIDWKHRLGGRGAYLCAASVCFSNAQKKSSFSKVFKTAISAKEPEKLLKIAQSYVEQQITTLLGCGMAAQLVVCGTDACLAALSKGKVSLLLLAKDTSLHDKFALRALDKSIPLSQVSTKDFLGEILGRRPTGVAVILDQGLAAAVAEAILRFDALCNTQCGNTALRLM